MTPPLGASKAAICGAAGVSTGVSESDILAMSPYMWLDADAQYVEEAADDVVEADADEVVYWRDRSGNDYDWNETTHVSSRAHWYSSGQNGKPYCYFVADRVKRTITEAFATPGTVYFVIEPDSDAQQSKNLVVQTGSKVITTYTNAPYPKAFRPFWGTDSANGSMFHNTQTTDPIILQILAGGASAGGGVDPKLRVNGGADEGVDAFAGSGEDNTLLGDTVHLAYLFNSFETKVYEVIFISDITHAQDDVFSYLGDKYDITVTAVS